MISLTWKAADIFSFFYRLISRINFFGSVEAFFSCESCFRKSRYIMKFFRFIFQFKQYLGSLSYMPNIYQTLRYMILYMIARTLWNRFWWRMRSSVWVSWCYSILWMRKWRIRVKLCPRPHREIAEKGFASLSFYFILSFLFFHIMFLGTLYSWNTAFHLKKI